jgi:hypothetical protein
MTELQLYGKDGLFHNAVKQMPVFDGRYGVLIKGGDLNTNNILSGVEFPAAKYPGVFCLPPTSTLPTTLQQGQWECFYFRLFFLCTTYSTGDNQIKSPDPNTNTSLHKVNMDWNDMKVQALAFMHGMEKVQLRLRGQFRLGQKDPWKIIRLSKLQNDNLSGVMVQFEAQIVAPCEFPEINDYAIELPSIDHPTHFH